MNENITPREIGQRCRRFRQLKEMSQQQLADRVGTTAQNISKYEKEGINGIEMIQCISNVLGYNLLKNERDEEGSVGEIGKEILNILILNKGFCDTEYIMKHGLHGLNNEQGLNEFFKLANIGMCVREKYIGYRNETIDRIYITAKGLITAKHLRVYEDESYEYDVNTYEEICEGSSSIQEIIDNNPIQRKIRNLNCTNDLLFRDLCKYIQYNYQEGPDEYINGNYEFMGYHDPNVGENAYFNILYCMILDMDPEKLKSLKEYYTDFDYVGDTIDERLGISDPVEDEFSFILENKIEGFGPEGCAQIREDMARERFKRKYPDAVYDEEHDDAFENMKKEDLEEEFTEGYKFDELAEKKGNMCVSDWFTKEEIINFINRNMISSHNIEEEQSRKDLIDIIKAEPKIIDSYFKFSTQWEENGIADWIRKNFMSLLQ